MVATDDRKLGEKFLRAYFEANYDATVESGNAVLMCVKAVFCENFCFEEKIIGGVMILLPDQGSWGWKAKDQEPYDRAYDKQEMHKINPEALRRLRKFVKKFSKISCLVYYYFNYWYIALQCFNLNTCPQQKANSIALFFIRKKFKNKNSLSSKKLKVVVFFYPIFHLKKTLKILQI